jgi:NADP-dependent 3-hydroxy acid dehydrogenase YdfG
MHASMLRLSRLKGSHSAQARVLMQGKTVVITGGTSGIGEVAAKALAGLGARIVLVAPNHVRTRRWHGFTQARTDLTTPHILLI